MEIKPPKANSGSVLESKYFPPIFMTLGHGKQYVPLVTRKINIFDHPPRRY